MGSEERVFQQRGGGSSGLNSGMVGTTNSFSDNFYGSNWDPMMSLAQTGDFGNSNMVPQSEFANPLMSENQTMGTSLVQFPSDSGLVGLLPRIPTFGSNSFSEMVTSFSHNTHLNLPHKKGVSQDHSPYGKRRRDVAQSASSPKNVGEDEEEEQKDPSGDDDEKKHEFEKNIGGGKQVGKQVKDNSNGAEDSYIHVRAKRGQATNSHSLAERVRRERISERMRLLQELVPGCNKITGKALMLDEIINYVQSLQQQVEFLSMKLATVNPELNVDIDRILSKDILQMRVNNAGPYEITQGLTSPLPFPAYPQGTFHNPTGTGAFHSSPQHEVQGLFQMGFDALSEKMEL